MSCVSKVSCRLRLKEENLSKLPLVEGMWSLQSREDQEWCPHVPSGMCSMFLWNFNISCPLRLVMLDFDVILVYMEFIKVCVGLPISVYLVGLMCALRVAMISLYAWSWNSLGLDRNDFYACSLMLWCMWVELLVGSWGWVWECPSFLVEIFLQWINALQDEL